MGWLQDIFKKIRGKPPTDYILIENLMGPDAKGEPITPDECYVSLFVESLRLTKERSFATKFHGVAYSFVKLVRQAEGEASYASISKPNDLAALDASSLNRVITVSVQMMSAAPWRGGTLDLQLGLFSVKAGNVLTPITDYVTKVSSAAGVKFVDTIKPFLPLVTEGLDLIAGQKGDTQIVVAIQSDLSPTKSGYYAIIEAEKGSIDVTKVTLDPTDRKLLLDGKPLDDGYCVFSIRSSPTKPDFGEIPALKARWADITAAIRANDAKKAKDALIAFRLETFASADLIPKHAEALRAKAAKLVADAFPAGAQSTARGSEKLKLPDLADLSLTS